MPRPPPSPEASIPIINSYCNERHEGKLVCVLDAVKGRILCATRPFAVGELILEEPPLHAVRLDPDNALCARLIDICAKQSFKHPAIWYWCALNSVLVEGDPLIEGLQTITRSQWDLLRILFMPGVVEPSSEAVKLVNCMGLSGIVDEIDMEIMIQIWLHNCFEHQRDPEGYVIYFMPSFCSHSCIPNALWCTDDNSNFRFFPRANISAGDEVTLTYLSEEDMLSSTSHRRALLEGAKDFKCMCERCVSPVDFSRGFRCPSCRSGVIYPHADETGSKHAFSGALLNTSEECRSTSPGSAVDSLHESVTPEDAVEDIWRHPLAPQPLSANGTLDVDGHLGRQEGQQTPVSIDLYTIWARLLTERREDIQGVSTQRVGGEPAVQSEPVQCPSTRNQSCDFRPSADAAANVDIDLPLGLSKLSALVSPQAVARVLQIPSSGCCCVCHYSWTEDQRQRALAVEKIIDATLSRIDEAEPEPVSPSVNGSVEALSDWDSSQRLYLEEDGALDERALEALQRVDLQTSLRILKKGWRSLDRQERLIVDFFIRLTFRSHWLAAHWFRFLESNSSASRKLPHLDRLIWQYRNLYPGLTPAVAWAVWDVAQALLSSEGNSKLRHSSSFRRYANQCIVSSYKESVFILSLLFGAGNFFTASIVDDYSASVKKCEERVMREKAPSWRSTAASGFPNSDTQALPNGFHLPKIWPCYISSCADVSISFSCGRALVPGTVVIDAYK